jgi:hypothetical protein
VGEKIDLSRCGVSVWRLDTSGGQKIAKRLGLRQSSAAFRRDDPNASPQPKAPEDWRSPKRFALTGAGHNGAKHSTA